jgi:hypothetical protein
MPNNEHPPFLWALFMMTVMSPSCWLFIGVTAAHIAAPTVIREHSTFAGLLAIALTAYTVYNLIAVAKYMFSTTPPPFAEISVYEWQTVHRRLFTADLIASTLLRAVTIDLLVGF